MTSRNKDVQKEVKAWFSKAKRVVIAGIGNPIRKDDYVGMNIVENLKGRISERVCLLECESVPESFLDIIVDFDPTHLLLIDAALLGLKPGETRLLLPQQVTAFPAISTHVLPLKIFCEYISKMTSAEIALLLIEPLNTEFGEGLTLDIQEAAKNITEMLLGLFPP